MGRTTLDIALVIACLAVMFALTGCNTASHSPDQDVAAAASRAEVEKELREKPFVIGVDDVVSVYVHLNPDLSKDYTVGAEGTVFMPLVGNVQAAALTKAELEKSLTEKLSKFIIEPQIAVGVSQYMSKKVYVIGEVTLPGPVPMKGNVLTVWDAIVAAGLPRKTAALWRVHVISPDAEQPIAKRVNLRSIMYRGRFADNDFLKPGDIVVVPSSTAASLGEYLGQIVRPASYARDMAEIYDFFKYKSVYLDRNYGRFTRWPE